MKAFGFTLSLWIIALVLAFAGRASAVSPSKKFPYLVEVSGKVSFTDREGKVTPAKKNQAFIEKASVETAAGSRALVQIDAHRRVHVLAESRLELPAISWETGEAPILVLKYGTIRWQQATKGSYNIALTSELVEFMPPVGDYVFVFDPKTAIAEVKVVEGKINFSAMHAEESAEVTAGQKCQFHGVKENGEIVYDVLLKGKKIPRGKLQKVEPFTAAEKRMYSAETLKKVAQEEARREKLEKAAAEKARDPLQICSAPAGRLNQCAWVCRGNPGKEKKTCRLGTPGVACVRSRCNANGEWADTTEITGDKAAALCGATARVRECDY